MLTRIKESIKSLTQTKIESLREESAAIIDIFTSTQESLTEVNTRIKTEKDLKQEAMGKLQKDIWDLDSITEGNTKIIDKINKLFE